MQTADTADVPDAVAVLLLVADGEPVTLEDALKLALVVLLLVRLEVATELPLLIALRLLVRDRSAVPDPTLDLVARLD